METLSFILGIASVVVIATAIVAVYAFVKVNKVSRNLEDVCRELDLMRSTIYRDMSDQFDNVRREVDSRYDNLLSNIDSRMDKLENKLTNKK